ncbi:TetR/AcrR family transcriptional regulator [Aureimonas psammosilenae]|uniref:TetR/AcrR family transcriptional regulator n=1 Tax=Aureimonas psammosilenae TaxID=2495496 RepID=UPI00126135CC|nr:TetR/AcrR family transcriptional regulator [Aureimonas psammosilenae]
MANPQPTRPSGNDEAREKRALARRNARAQAIMAEAQALFVTHGFDAVSMDMVAASAGMSKVTIYKYFAGKDELLTTIVLQWLKRINESIWTLGESDRDMSAVLRRIAVNFYDVFLTNEAVGFRRMLFGILPRFPELGQLIYAKGPAAVMARIADFLRVETEKGNAAIPDPEFAAIQFHSLLQSDLELRGLLLSQTPSKADLVRRADCAVDMFVTYYARRT